MKRVRGLVAGLVLAASAVGLSCGDDGSRVDNANPRPTPVDGGVIIPASWAGEWNLVFTFVDCNSRHVVTIEDVVGTICPSDTLNLDITPVLANCDGLIDDDRIDAGCSHEYTAGSCDVTVSVLLNIDRDGDTITGSGVWTAETEGACYFEYQPGCEQFEVTGTRLDPAPAVCAPVSASPFEVLTARARLAAIRSGGPGAGGDGP